MKYVNLEDLDLRTLATEDPRGFLATYPSPLIVDEIQRAPSLVSYIQSRVDEVRSSGQYILTGSQNFEIKDTVSQSLAGRAAMVELLPFSYGEVYKDKRVAIKDVLYKGFYPRIHDKKLNPTQALAFYTATYLERDIKQLIQLRELSSYEKFLKLCATHVGQLINYSEFSSHCGVDQKTIKNWFSVLQASYIVFLLQPYFNNRTKRLVKSPKLYFYDVGLATYLLGIQKAEQVLQHPLQGALFENFVVAELVKNRKNNILSNDLFFYRDHAQNEIDVVIEKPTGCDLIEIKSSQTFHPEFVKGFKSFPDAQTRTHRLVVYGGRDILKYAENKILPYHGVAKL